MAPLPATDPQPARLGASRRRVLSALQDAGTPMCTDDVAARVGLHPNTARFHLDGLVADDLAARSVEARSRPGRPRTLFVAAPGDPAAGDRSYHLLANVMTGYLASTADDPAKTACDVGAEWGRYLAEPVPPFRRASAGEAVDLLVERLDGVGFQTRPEDTGDEVRLRVTHCPFLETAREHRDVVCSVHLGMMRGMLARVRAPLTVDSLDPLVEPTLCIAHLTRTSGPDGRTPDTRG